MWDETKNDVIANDFVIDEYDEAEPHMASFNSWLQSLPVIQSITPVKQEDHISLLSDTNPEFWDCVYPSYKELPSSDCMYNTPSEEDFSKNEDRQLMYLQENFINANLGAREDPRDDNESELFDSDEEVHRGWIDVYDCCVELDKADKMWDETKNDVIANDFPIEETPLAQQAVVIDEYDEAEPHMASFNSWLQSLPVMQSITPVKQEDHISLLSDTNPEFWDCVYPSYKDLPSSDCMYNTPSEEDFSKNEDRQLMYLQENFINANLGAREDPRDDNESEDQNEEQLDVEVESVIGESTDLQLNVEKTTSEMNDYLSSPSASQMPHKKDKVVKQRSLCAYCDKFVPIKELTSLPFPTSSKLEDGDDAPLADRMRDDIGK